MYFTERENLDSRSIIFTEGLLENNVNFETTLKSELTSADKALKDHFDTLRLKHSRL